MTATASTMSDPTSLIVFLIVVIGAVAGAWWRIESAIKAAKIEAIGEVAKVRSLADENERQLASLRLHVAESYVTKAGLRETSAQIIEAVNGVKVDVHALNERLDRIIDYQQPPARSRRTS